MKKGVYMKIRQERIEDHNKIRALVKAAFDSAEHADGNEQNLVTALRRSKNYIPQLALVAEENGEIVGHIMFSKATVGDNEVLALAPLSVLPDYQRKGIGTALIKEGHKIARQLGYEYVVVLGSEIYYPKVGYVPADMLGIVPPFDVPRENFMAYQLDEFAQKIHGVIHYAKEFGV